MRDTGSWLPLMLITIAPGLAFIAFGCGGGGGGATTYSVSGRIATEGMVSDPSSIVVGVEGTTITAHPNPDGTFTLQGVPAGNLWVYAISPDGAVAGRVEVEVNGDQPEIDVGTLPLWPAGQIAGLVTAPGVEGQPVPVAEVSMTATGEPAPILPPEPPLPPTDPGIEGGRQDGTTPPVLEFHAVTDVDGSYLIKGVPGGTYTVRAEKDGYAPQEIVIYVEPGRTAVADFVLSPPVPPGGRIVGTVTGVTPTGEQTPLAGALVIAVSSDTPMVEVEDWTKSLERTDSAAALSIVQSGVPDGMPWPWPDPPAGIVAATRTDETGHYVLDMPEGCYTVVAYAEAYKVGVQWGVWVTGGQDTPVDFVLVPGPLAESPLRVALQTDKVSYLPGEPVVMTLSVLNAGQETQTLHFPSSQQYDFAVDKGPNLIWRWGAGQVFLPADSQLTLEPGQLVSFKEAWNQLDQSGTQVPPDFYGLIGVLPANEGPLAACAWMLIEGVLPPPVPL